MSNTPDEFRSWGELPTAVNPNARQPGDTDPALRNAPTPSIFLSDGAVPTRQPPPRAPDQLAAPPSDESGSPRYLVERKLGGGGMGDVFLARDTRLQRQVVLKRIRPELANRPGMVERLFAEAQAAAQLNHRHIVTVYDRGRDEQGEFLVMEYVEGSNLFEVLQQNGGTLTIERSVKYIRQIGEALQVAHDAGIVHRDIKPSNILISLQDEAKLADFGLARIAIDSGHTQAGAVLGTLDFMAPEQHRESHTASPLSDQYSLAATLYQLLTGRSPRIIRADLLPEILRGTVLKALDEQPSQRFRRVSDLLAVLPGAVTPVSAAESVDLADTLERRKAHFDELLVIARRLIEQEHAYAQAVSILKQIPEHLRDAELLRVAKQRHERVVKLDADIRQRVAEYRTTGLRPLVRELLNLQPARQDMQRLMASLASVPSTAPQLLQAPFNAGQIADARSQWSDHLGCWQEQTNSIGVSFAFIPPGEFDMGSNAFSDAQPIHRVKLTKPLWLATTPVTQQQYQAVMGTNPSHFAGNPQNPVEKVSWFDAVEFCNKLSEREGLSPYYRIEKASEVKTSGFWIFKTTETIETWINVIPSVGNGYRLPTEAEWEYACRAGSTGQWCFGDEEGELQNYAWTAANSESKTQPVARKRANHFGLFDMHGNVWEWCWDWFDSNYYATSVSAENPLGPAAGSFRSYRGGSWWISEARWFSAAYRFRLTPSNRSNNLGFRLAAVPAGK
ncbi:MAG: bifunctional serine/threonine-protein kinase/formylglycine-generating enzyme family protein [Planctomycetaceae bacterium]